MRLPFLLVLPFSCFLTQLQASDTLYVWAKNGLSFRAEPNMNAERIEVLAYGTQIIMHRKTHRKDSVQIIPASMDKYTNKPNDPFYLFGNWAEVEVNGQIGYVFDAYISKMLPFKAKETNLDLLDEWLKEQYGILDTIGNLDSEEWQSIVFGNHTLKRGGYRSPTTYIFPRKYTFREGYLLLNYILLDKYDFSLENLNKAEYVFIKAEDASIIFDSLGFDGIQFGFHISYKNGVLTFSYLWSC